MGKYTLQKSKKPNHWVITDTENLITIIFEEGNFNESQKVTMLGGFNNKNLSKLPKITQELGDFLVKNHSNIL